MAQNITLLGASYSDVPSVTLPKTGGGTASFTDVSDTTAAAGDVASGKYFYTSAGVRTQGTSSGGGTSVKTKTGTFTGNGTRTIDISSVAFEPDIVYFSSDPGTTSSSGTVAAIIVRGMMAATRYRNNSTTNSHYAQIDITGMNTGGSSYSWRATYDSTNSKLTLYCFSNNARALLTNNRTYSYQLVKYTS